MGLSLRRRPPEGLSLHPCHRPPEGFGLHPRRRPPEGLSFRNLRKNKSGGAEGVMTGDLKTRNGKGVPINVRNVHLKPEKT